MGQVPVLPGPLGRLERLDHSVLHHVFGPRAGPKPGPSNISEPLEDFFVGHGPNSRGGAPRVGSPFVSVMQSLPKQDAHAITRGRTLTRFERLSLALETLGMDERTVAAAYADPSRVRESTLRRLARAAKKLGLPSPYDFGTAGKGEP